MPKTISVVGEPFLSYVKGQIEHRQRVYGSGINRARTADEISYLNSRNSWIKLASAVNVLSRPNDESESTLGGIEGEARLRRIFSNLKQAHTESHENFKGAGLARNFVLFNGTSVLQEDNTYSSRAGVTDNNTFANDSAYGLGGTEFGIQPMPGITGFNVNHRNNGSLRDGTINLTAYNRFQFDVIESLYLRLGYTMLIEWGNSIYYDTTSGNPMKYQKMGTTMVDNWWWTNQQKGVNYLQILEEIERNRQKYTGNYDGFVCVVSNFKWTVETDGTYNIDIEFVSLGSVIESLKVTPLPPQYNIKLPQDTETDITEINTNTISNWMYVQRKQKTYTGEFEVLPPNQTDLANAHFVNLLKQNEIPVSLGEKYPYYIRFGYFLEFCEKHVLRHYKHQETCFPIINIARHQESLCNISESTVISIDPRICIVKPNDSYFKSIGGDPPSFSAFLRDFFIEGRTKNEFFGIIDNIYLNFDFIQSNLPSDNKELNFHSFLTSILRGINSCFGGEMNLGITIQEESNTLVIRDENLKPGTKVSINKDEEITVGSYTDKEYPEIEWFGYNRSTGTSNFLTGFSFETGLSNNFLNQISIGATAANQSVNEDATAYEVWSAGLLDGYKRGGTDGIPNGCKRDSNETEVKADRDPLSTEFILEDTPIAESTTVAPTTGERTSTFATFLSNGLKFLFGSGVEAARNLAEVNKQNYFSWKNYLGDAFFATTNLRAPGGNEGGTRNNYNNTINSSKYFKFDDDFITRGKRILDAARESQAKERKEKLKKSSGYSGYLPAELSLTLDGLSGIRIYNGLRLNSDLLPYNYPEALDFIVVGLDHSIVENDWQTTVRALVAPSRTEEELPPPSDVGAFTATSGSSDVAVGDEEGEINENLPETLTLYPPTNNIAVLSIIRNDSGGFGSFGAARNGRVHRGIDLSTRVSNSYRVNLIEEYPLIAGQFNPTARDFTPGVSGVARYGTRIYAPISGEIRFSRATTSSRLPGCKIIGSGDYRGITVYIFYMHTDADLRWKKSVAAGDTIGYGLDLSVDYSENVGDHIHFAIKKNGVYVDPLEQDYSTTV